MPLRAASLPPQLLMPLLFLSNGIFLGMWVASIPDITGAIGMDHSATGRVLSAFPLGGLVAFPLAAIATRRFGSRAILLAFGALRVATFLSLALAGSELMLAAALAVVGFAHGGLDVSLNNQAVEMERAHGLSLLPRAHAAYSIGTLTGSFGGGLLEGVGLPTAVLFLAPMLIASWAYGTARAGLVADTRAAAAETGSPVTGRFPVPAGALLVLLAIAFISEIGDEAISDWYALYLREDLQSLPAVASMDFSVFALGILLVRLFGEPLTRQLSAARTLQLSGAVAGLGMLIGIAGNTPAVMLAGTFITGLGYSMILPTLYRQAGSLPGMPQAMAMSLMAAAVYLGFMVGPLVIGPVSNALTLRAALALVGVLFFTVPLLARTLGSRATKPRLLPR